VVSRHSALSTRGTGMAAPRQPSRQLDCAADLGGRAVDWVFNSLCNVR
jgi:hypothetical protein